MKAFGLVSLLVALAIVALLAVRQTKVAIPTPDPAAPAASAASPRALQEQVRTDVTRVLEQGAARNADADR